MNYQGLSLVLITVLFLLSIVVISVGNLKYRYYFLSSSKFALTRLMILRFMCIFTLIWFVAFRVVPTFQSLLAIPDINNYASNHRNATLAVFFSLDLCGLFSWLLPLALLLPKKYEGIKKSIALIAFLGGTVALFGHAAEAGMWDPVYIFIGKNDKNGIAEPLFYLMHTWMIAFSIYYLCICSNITLKDMRTTVIIFSLFIIYILIMSSALNIKAHVTGLVLGDYFISPGSPGYDNTGLPIYYVVPTILKINQSLWWVCPILMYTLFAILISAFVYLRNQASTKIRNYYCNQNYNLSFMQIS